MKTVCSIAFALLFTIPAAAGVLRVQLDDVIHPISDEFVGRALDEAAAKKADAVVIEAARREGSKPRCAR